MDTLVFNSFVARHQLHENMSPNLPQVQPCWLLNLPDELKLCIVDLLDRKRDLYNLSRTCRVLEDMTLIRLYKSVDIEIPAERDAAWSTGGYLRLRPHVINAVQDLTIYDGITDAREPQYHRRRRSDAGSAQAYACQIVDQVPSNQLKAFSFMHGSPISLRTMDILARKHEHSLKELRFYELESLSGTSVLIPKNLDTLECRSIREGEIIGRIVQANKKTLQRLRLGQERELIEHYRRSRVGFLPHIAEPLQSFKSIVDISELQNLREISLIGLDVSPLVPTTLETALYLTKLSSITLESCSASVQLLDTLAGMFTHVQNNAIIDPTTKAAHRPSLKTFTFRHEAFTTILKDSLINFLNSFSGLTSLSLLFENGSLIERPSFLMSSHGSTLRNLTLETRIQPREHLALDTSRPFGMGGYNSQLWEESINDICSLCPNLEELGMGFPWDDEMVRLRKSRLPCLKKLRTMHIRNFPESQALSQLGEYSIKEYATKFMNWVWSPVASPGPYPALEATPEGRTSVSNFRSQPMLETLSIGPSIYESRWKGSNPGRRQIPEFLRTHHFAIDWAQTRFGHWSALTTSVHEKYMHEERGEKPLKGVFEAVWLR